MGMTLKQARVGIGYSQTEMAKRLGISLNTYRRYEANPDRMMIDKALKFCEITGTTPDDIFFGVK